MTTFYEGINSSLKVGTKEGEGSQMGTGESRSGGYILAALLGAVGGGIAVALATKPIPKMMAQMKESGRDPSQM